jgi:tRNA uridine 5-carbamoylmethylation protein Kti12
MKVINLFGQPGAGKSTSAAGLFFLLKRRNVNCELVTEYAKRLVWADRHATFNDQIYLFAKQNHLLFNLKGKVDIAVTDSPLLLNVAYSDKYSQTYKDLVCEVFKSYDNLNFFIKRVKPYNPKGRNQTEDESDALVDVIKNILVRYEVPHVEIEGDDEAPKRIMEIVLDSVPSVSEA